MAVTPFLAAQELAKLNVRKWPDIQPAHNTGMPIIPQLMGNEPRQVTDTLKAHSAECVGMAANMIGVRKRIIVVDLGGMTLEMFNPRIISRSVPYEAVEGCLSLYGARSVTRYKNIKVEWKTRAFQTRTQTFTGLIAQIIQHEIDHCNGILI